MGAGSLRRAPEARRARSLTSGGVEPTTRSLRGAHRCPSSTRAWARLPRVPRLPPSPPRRSRGFVEDRAPRGDCFVAERRGLVLSIFFARVGGLGGFIREDLVGSQLGFDGVETSLGGGEISTPIATGSVSSASDSATSSSSCRRSKSGRRSRRRRGRLDDAERHESATGAATRARTVSRASRANARAGGAAIHRYERRFKLRNESTPRSLWRETQPRSSARARCHSMPSRASARGGAERV